jgi:protease-4
LKKIGVDYQVIKAGSAKDAGSPFRPLTPEEREWLTGVLGDVHEQFIDAIVASRPLPADSVRALADGRLFSGRQAYQSGLVDRLADLDEAVRVAGRMAGIEGEPETVRERKHIPAWQRWFEEHVAGALTLPRGWARLEYR